MEKTSQGKVETDDYWIVYHEQLCPLAQSLNYK